MKQSDRSAQMDLTLDIHWEKHRISHHEHFFIHKLNTWRDLEFQKTLIPAADAAEGESFSTHLPPEKWMHDNPSGSILAIKKSRIAIPDSQLIPGRFYPQGLLSGLPGVFKGNINPFRLLELSGDKARIDLSHPLSQVPLEIRGQVLKRREKFQERGGSCTDWMEAALTGPGMQKRREKDQPTRFLTSSGLSRKDETPDELFYETDRMVPHVDATASKNLSMRYQGLLKPSDTVLDLMAGFESHIGRQPGLHKIHGLGMNQNEMRQNPALSDFTIQDLNRMPHLPFDDHSFDAVICSLSVEYLIQPIAVFKSVERVLKPGGVFCVGFSNRWFPEKTIQIWESLHDFERMGLILEYFHESGGYSSLETHSVRGYPRPTTDRYADRMRFSDPVFLVAGKKKKG